MARERLTFRQRDVTAALRAVEKAGHKVARVEIGPDGRIILELAPLIGNEPAPGPEPNPWDQKFHDHKSQ